MERQAGLGRSLEDVLDAVPPIEPTDPPSTHALFGIATEEAPEDAPVIVPVANGTSHSDSKKTSKSKKSKGDDKKKKKKKKKKSEQAKKKQAKKKQRKKKQG